MTARFSRGPAVVALVTLVYFAAGKLGLMLAFVNPSATAVWPPTGIALVAFLILGYRIWPAILMGAFLVNLTTVGSISTSIGIAVGNTLEGLVGAYLVNRFANGRHAFDRAQDIFKFSVLAALLGTTVSATIGVTSLALGGFAKWVDFRAIWLTWWLGDAAGDLVLAPALLLWSARPRFRLATKGGRLLEAALFVPSLLLVGAVVFSGFFPTGTRNYPLEFLCIPLLVWAAFRFGKRDAATATLILSGIAIWGTLKGFGPFRRDTPNESLLLLQAFMGVVAVMTTSLAAVVSERRRIESSLNLLEVGVENAAEGIVILVAGSPGSIPRVTFVNGGFSRITGLLSARVLGQTLDVLGISESDHEVRESMSRAMAQRQRFHAEMHARRADGSEYALEVELTPVSAGNNRPTHWAGVLRDVSVRVAQLAALEHQATYDFLTGLPNRVLLHDRLDQAILSARREGVRLALFLMDLDRFKQVNDTFGHQSGDILLKQLGARLRGVLRTVDTVARLGGDEFGILLPRVGDKVGASLMAEKILKVLDEPFEVENNSVKISASIGIALYPDHGGDWTDLMRSADVAMYAAKKSTNGYALYSLGDYSGSPASTEGLTQTSGLTDS